MSSPLCELDGDLLLCIFDATLTRLGPQGYVALECLSATCRALRASRKDPGVVLRLCETIGVSRRLRSRFHPGASSHITTEGFYRRVVSPEHALRTDAQFECAVVAGDTARMVRLLAMGASVHTPDYAWLKQEGRQRHLSVRSRECHASGYESDESDAVTPLLQRAAICGHAAACALLLHVVGELPAEKEPLGDHVHRWGACPPVPGHPATEQPMAMGERHELNDAADAAYGASQIGTLSFLLSMGALVTPRYMHEHLLVGAVLDGDVFALRTLTSVAKGPAPLLHRMINLAVTNGSADVFRELRGQGATPDPRKCNLGHTCGHGHIALLDQLLPLLCAAKDREWDRARELSEGLNMACRSLSLAAVRLHSYSSTFLAIANRLLDVDARPCDGVAAQEGGLSTSTLVLACRSGNAPLVQRLVDAGASIDEAGGLPMKTATALNHVEVIDVLHRGMVRALNLRLRTVRE